MAQSRTGKSTGYQNPPTLPAEVFDLVVVGGGPAGYVAAIRAAQLGMRVALVEKNSTLGGTCLNVGCIPSKALLDSSELYARLVHEGERHGIVVKGGPAALGVDVAAMQKRKAEVVTKLTGGVAGLLSARKITVVQGLGKLMPAASARDAEGNLLLQVCAAPSEATWGARAEWDAPAAGTLRCKRILLAAGSVPTSIPGLDVDHRVVLDSTSALSLDRIPQRLIVIGGGAIGLELGSVYARLGSKVTVVEALPSILNGWDSQVQTLMTRELTKQGFTLTTGAKVQGLTQSGKNAVAKLSVTLADGTQQTLEADAVLVSVGRRALLEPLGLAEAGVALDARGRFIAVDTHFATSVDGVYAVGDCIGGAMLAHKAEEEAVAAVELMAGKAGHVNYGAIPGVVYTWPEAACVGATEELLKEDGIPYRKGVFNLAANGRALAMDSAAGFVKILAHESTDRVLGAHIVGPWASDLIAEITTAMELGASAEDIGRICHAHPTLPEAVKEAALAVGKRAIHAL